MRRELTEGASQVLLMDGNEIVQSLAADRPDYSFAVCIRHRTSNRCLQYFQTKTGHRFIDFARKTVSWSWIK
jgi:hypothetical protein